MPISLFFREGRQRGKTYELTPPLVRLGRSSSNDIQIQDNEASRSHAELRFRGKTVQLVDCESANGTYLNGRRIRFAELSSGDLIGIGKSVMLFTNPTVEVDADPTPLLAISRDLASYSVDSSKSQKGSENPADSSVNEDFHLSDEQTGSQGAPNIIARSEQALKILLDTADVIRRTTDEKTLCIKILEHAFSLTNADRGGVLLTVSGSSDLQPAVVRDLRAKETVPAERIFLSETIIQHVRETREGVLTLDAPDDGRWAPSDSIMASGIREAICVPIVGRQEFLGILYLDTKSPNNHKAGKAKFSTTHLDTCNTIAQQLGIAIEYSRFYAALLEKERLAAIGQISATLSHNIKNLMQGVESGAFLVDEGLASSDWKTLKKGWEICARYQKEVSRTFMNILSFSREREIIPMPTEFSVQLNRLVDFARSLSILRNVEIIVENKLPNGKAKLEFDSQAIYHCLLNLVSNAFDAVRDVTDAEIKISAQILPKSEQLKIVVHDNGIGIPPEIQNKIFKEFATTKGQNGSGIGLVTTWKIIEEHNGFISFTSNPGNTTFEVFLPLGESFDLQSTSSESITEEFCQVRQRTWTILILVHQQNLRSKPSINPNLISSDRKVDSDFVKQNIWRNPCAKLLPHSSPLALSHLFQN
ncbi:MAG: ATP-binding protein [Pirellulaceae bacterium]